MQEILWRAVESGVSRGSLLACGRSASATPATHSPLGGVRDFFHPGHASGPPCAKPCFFEHEATHKRHCDEGKWDFGPRDWSECQAWCNTLKCLAAVFVSRGRPLPKGVPWPIKPETCGPLRTGSL